MAPLTIVALEGDQTGQELLEQALRVLDPGVLGLDLELTAGHVEALRRREIESRDQWQEETVRREGVAAALGALEAGLNDQKLALLELERELTTAQGGLRDREEARTRAERLNNGVPLPDDVWATIVAAARSVGINDTAIADARR